MIQRAWEAWLDEGRWLWRTSPWWVCVCWAVASAALGIAIGAVIAGAVAGALVSIR